MNKYFYAPTIILVQALSFLIAIYVANLKSQQNSNMIGLNVLEYVDEKLTVNDALNLAQNDDFSEIDAIDNFMIVPLENSDQCSLTYQVGEQKEKQKSNVNFLPQVKGADLFKGIYDYGQNSVCQVDDNNQVITRIVNYQEPQEEIEDIYNYSFQEIEKISLLDFNSQNTRLKYNSPTPISLENNQEFGNIANINRQVSNYQSLSLISSLATKPATAVSNVNQLSPITRTSTLSQGSNTIQIQPITPSSSTFTQSLNLNYFNAISGANSIQNSVNTNYIGNYNIPSSSPILEELRKQQKQQEEELRKQQQKQQEQINKQLEQQREQQKKLEEQRRKEQRQKQLEAQKKLQEQNRRR